MDYQTFFADFKPTDITNDPLPLKVLNHSIEDSEVGGQSIYWAFQYLYQKNCPSCLLTPLLKRVVQVISDTDLSSCVLEGYNQLDDTGDVLDTGSSAPNRSYQPLKLMQTVTAKIDEVCMEFKHAHESSDTIDGIQHHGANVFDISFCSKKNTRRSLEDRMIILPNLDIIYNSKLPISYFAVFDGHNGVEAAAYAAAQLHRNLISSPSYPSDITSSIHEAFQTTDLNFLAKCSKENIKSGATVVLALVGIDKIHVAWAGDSQAVLVKSSDNIVSLVSPHKPERDDEMQRIKDVGGEVLLLSGTWRVNGNLAVSRAIGDPDYKSYVVSTPEVRTVERVGDEEFLILACDGLWDDISPQRSAQIVRNHLIKNGRDLDGLSQALASEAKKEGCADNITIIVVFLQPIDAIIERYSLDNLNLLESEPCTGDKENVKETNYKISENGQSDCLIENLNNDLVNMNLVDASFLSSLNPFANEFVPLSPTSLENGSSVLPPNEKDWLSGELASMCAAESPNGQFDQLDISKPIDDGHLIEDIILTDHDIKEEGDITSEPDEDWSFQRDMELVSMRPAEPSNGQFDLLDTLKSNEDGQVVDHIIFTESDVKEEGDIVTEPAKDWGFQPDGELVSTCVAESSNGQFDLLDTPKLKEEVQVMEDIMFSENEVKEKEDINSEPEKDWSFQRDVELVSFHTAEPANEQLVQLDTSKSNDGDHLVDDIILLENDDKVKDDVKNEPEKDWSVQRDGEVESTRAAESFNEQFEKLDTLKSEEDNHLVEDIMLQENDVKEKIDIKMEPEEKKIDIKSEPEKEQSEIKSEPEKEKSDTKSEPDKENSIQRDDNIQAAAKVTNEGEKVSKGVANEIIKMGANNLAKKPPASRKPGGTAPVGTTLAKKSQVKTATATTNSKVATTSTTTSVKITPLRATPGSTSLVRPASSPTASSKASPKSTTTATVSQRTTTAASRVTAPTGTLKPKLSQDRTAAAAKGTETVAPKVRTAPLPSTQRTAPKPALKKDITGEAAKKDVKPKPDTTALPKPAGPSRTAPSMRPKTAVPAVAAMKPKVPGAVGTASRPPTATSGVLKKETKPSSAALPTDKLAKGVPPVVKKTVMIKSITRDPKPTGKPTTSTLNKLPATPRPTASKVNAKDPKLSSKGKSTTTNKADAKSVEAPVKKEIENGESVPIQPIQMNEDSKLIAPNADKEIVVETVPVEDPVNVVTNGTATLGGAINMPDLLESNNSLAK